MDTLDFILNNSGIYWENDELSIEEIKLLKEMMEG